MADLNQSIDQVSYVERQILHLIRMVDALDNFIELDVPFLEQERDERIAGLRELMGKANVDVSEKNSVALWKLIKLRQITVVTLRLIRQSTLSMGKCKM